MQARFGDCEKGKEFVRVCKIWRLREGERVCELAKFGDWERVFECV